MHINFPCLWYLAVAWFGFSALLDVPSGLGPRAGAVPLAAYDSAVDIPRSDYGSRVWEKEPLLDSQYGKSFSPGLLVVLVLRFLSG